ncbi:MAG TPA: lysophospholipid acyltransferase family protein [Azonexus sp.]|nr:lysophospholipid acyltransferase family protein [Azonexus sp.]
MTDPRRSGNPLWIAYEYVAMVVGLGSLAIICLGWLPFALIFNPLLSRSRGQRWGRYMIMDGFRTYLNVLSRFCACRFDLSALDQLRGEGPLILAANHPSLLDAVLIVSRLPNAVCVMKASLMDNILFGAAARLARYIRNNNPLEMILSAREELQGGAHLVIFPEGTRTAHFPVDACSPSTALIAGRTGIPVQTLLIEYSVPYLGKAWPLWKRPVLPLHCRIRLGRRFPAPANVGALTGELESYFRAELGRQPMDCAVTAT